MASIPRFLLTGSFRSEHDRNLIINEPVNSPAGRTLNSPARPQQNIGRSPLDDGGYSGEVRVAWIEFLNTVPAAARILDLGIGNHVPALIAADLAASSGREWQIDSVDPGGVNVDGKLPRAGSRDRIAFHSGATFDKLPFKDAMFDAACGHHVLEFSDAGKALAEVHRVLKPGGEAQFLLHHADSPLLRAARVSLREADLVFGQTKAFRRLHKLVTMSQIIPDSTERATNDVRSAIRTLKRGLQVAQQGGGGRVLSVALDSIQKLLAARREAKPDLAGLAVDRAEAELRASVRRLGDLVERARTDADMRVLERTAVDLGFAQIERAVQLHAGTEPMAWQLLVRRA